MSIARLQPEAIRTWSVAPEVAVSQGASSTHVPPKQEPSEHRLLARVDAWPELPAPLHAAMLSIWHAVPSLQRRFPLHKGHAFDALGFSSWCVSDGRRQYALLREIPAWDKALAAPIDLSELSEEWAGTWSVAMFLYGVARHQCASTAWTRRATVRRRIAMSWWRGKRHERCAPAPEPWQYAALVRSFSTWNRFMAALREPADSDKSNEQLLVDFGLEDVRPWFDHGIAAPPTEPPVTAQLNKALHRGFAYLPARVSRLVTRVRTRLRSRPSEAELADVMRRVPVQAPLPVRSDHPFGVNLFGYAFGEIGIGEDVRCAAEALRARGIPFCVVNVQPGKNVSQLDASIAESVVDTPRYAINLFCITGKEHVRLVCEQGLGMLRGRYTIGMWPWELPRWPLSCRHAYTVVDEIWGISRYTAQAYADAPCPVVAMTLPVTVDAVGAETRADFDLPEADYLFVFSFDFNSTSTRKNPEAVIAAFQAAFPAEGKESVGLVVKASHTHEKHPGWQHLRHLAATDRRIHLIGQTLRRSSVLALYRCCDCYVSLHRAEGFGRGIAEALLLGKQVIATGFSGNMDFCDEGRVGLVRYHMTPLAASDYFHGDGQHWAEPDIDHAAVHLRKAFQDRAQPRGPAPDFGLATVGAAYGRRLTDVHELLGAVRLPGPAVTEGPLTIDIGAPAP